jgi:ubiquinone/menaquinone biosynthesis C-methylase UbiE/uncharacterized protein YbaR (Trm112 family)
VVEIRGLELECPACRGELERPAESEIVCRGCGKAYPVVLGIPDLRVFPDPYIGVEEERRKVARLAERFGDEDFAGLLDFYYSITPVVSPQLAEQYKASLHAAAPRTRAWLSEWERQSGVEPDGDAAERALLDVGCGTGALLLAAEGRYGLRAGVDIALRWLVMCRRRLADGGVELPLVCACAEALPLPGGRFDTVTLDSTIEHLEAQDRALGEVHRVMKPAARLYVATPNRFSVGPDPATKIWAGSWLPERVTAWLVARSGGLPPKRHLLSARSLRRLLASSGFTDIRIDLPGVPAGQRAHFPAPLRAAMTGYELARGLPFSRAILRAVGPILQSVARRAPEAATARAGGSGTE